MAALTRNLLVELFWSLHPRLYALSGGRIGGSVMGVPVLLLTTTGRKSGASRTVALTCLVRGDAFVVIASVLGEPRHPAWYLNLEANPQAEVEFGGRRRRVRARVAEGEERALLWRAMADKLADYDEYAARTSRRIPVVVLEPVV
jgi:deazaflavin-dependent oxidoreductase (nitroreductase family)